MQRLLNQVPINNIISLGWDGAIVQALFHTRMVLPDKLEGCPSAFTVLLSEYPATACVCRHSQGEIPELARQLRGRVLEVVEHLRQRLGELGHVLWSMAVFICVHGGIRGGVHLRQRLVGHGDARGSSARVLAGVEHRAARRSSSTWTIGGHVSWSMDTSVEHGGVHLGS